MLLWQPRDFLIKKIKSSFHRAADESDRTFDVENAEEEEKYDLNWRKIHVHVRPRGAFSQKTDANGPWKPWQMCCRCYLLYTKTCNWTWSVLFPVFLLGLILTSWMRPVSLELSWIKQCSDKNQFEGLLPARGDVISMRCASTRLANVWELQPCWCSAVVRLICWEAPSSCACWLKWSHICLNRSSISICGPVHHGPAQLLTASLHFPGFLLEWHFSRF